MAVRPTAAEVKLEELGLREVERVGALLIPGV